MNYDDKLRILAEKKLAQKNSSQDYQDEQNQQDEDDNSNDNQENGIPFPEVEPDEEELIAKNEKARQPASTENALPINKEDVQLIQGLDILDKIQMKRQNLDPWNPRDVQKYRRSQGT